METVQIVNHSLVHSSCFRNNSVHFPFLRKILMQRKVFPFKLFPIVKLKCGALPVAGCISQLGIYCYAISHPLRQSLHDGDDAHMCTRVHAYRSTVTPAAHGTSQIHVTANGRSAQCVSSSAQTGTIRARFHKCDPTPAAKRVSKTA